MIVSKKTTKERKLMAVIGNNGLGFWFRSATAPDASYYVNESGVIKDNLSLEEVLKSSNGLRTPVYEDEEITFKF